MEESLARARLSLEGLSVGDSLGGFFEMARPGILNQKRLPSPPWHFTDDTNMALSIYAILRQYGQIDQDRLAESFAEHFDRSRGYGMGMVHMLPRVRNGGSWREIAPAMFGEQGSFGNGAAMRVAPIGAYFADDLDAVVEQARRSAVVTHAHPEAVAGAIAAACAAAYAWRLRDSDPRPTRVDLSNIYCRMCQRVKFARRLSRRAIWTKQPFRRRRFSAAGFRLRRRIPCRSRSGSREPFSVSTRLRFGKRFGGWGCRYHLRDYWRHRGDVDRLGWNSSGLDDLS